MFPRTGLIDLPWEDVLIAYVLPHLSIVDIFRLRSVSRDFLDLIQAYFLKEKCFDWTGLRNRTSQDAFKIATKDTETLHKLVVTSCRGWVKDENLLPIIRRNPRLDHIDLSECLGLSCLTISTIAGSCPSLTTILLRECHWVSSSMIECLTMQCRNLERIDLSGCWQLTDDTIYMLASLQPRLRWLSLARIYSITPVSVEQLALNCCQELEYLDLEGCWRVNDVAIQKLADKCLSLKTLKIRDCRISERSLSRLRCQGVSIDVRGLRPIPVNPLRNPPPVNFRQFQVPLNYRL